MKITNTLVILSAAVLMLSSVASAHPGHRGHDAGFSAGVSHPFSGIDHILAMVAVGLLAAQVGGKAIWMLPCAFVGLMLGGGLLNWAGVTVPLVEQGIMTSVLVLGLMIAVPAKMPVLSVASLVGLFAIFHGYAHVTEMSAEHSASLYGIGFILATAILHIIGICLGLTVPHYTSAKAIRIGGAAIAVCGVLMILHVFQV